MKICVTSTGKDLDSEVDPRFGRCKVFLLLDPGNLQFEALENPHGDFTGGAGIQSGQLMITKGVNAVLTGNVGPNAYQVLSAAGIKVYTGASGRVKEAVENYKLGKYKTADSPSVGSKFGMPGK
ncbi:MAG: NifB/NifX family molybdenum-iron cluster-binding protein [Candidatus Omnitrophica bacterium]|nr:NifB/NifX family molybdenum-iron cluster-binding protein [Candidatus Omnitrophota bacterium]